MVDDFNLNGDYDEEEEKKLPQIVSGTTGDTKDKPKKGGVPMKKMVFDTSKKISIDTDAINELFTFGGEKGELMM